MRSIVTVAAMALGLGLAGIQTISAAPVNGTVIQNAADLTQGTEQVQYGYGYGYGYGYRSYGYGYSRYGYGYRRY